MPPAFQIPDLSRFTGFDPETGGYAVANDASKLFGQALAELEARSKAPRSDIFGQTLKEDTAPALKAELLDPLLAHFGMQNFGRPGAALQPKVYHTGNSLVSLDPTTGKADVIYQPPAKPEVQPDISVPIYPPGTDPKLAHLLGIVPTTVRGKLPQVASMVGTNMPASLMPQGMNTFMQSVDAGKKLAKESMTPSAFIGTPGVTPPITLNLPSGNPASGTSTNSTKRIGRFSIIPR